MSFMCHLWRHTCGCGRENSHFDLSNLIVRCTYFFYDAIALWRLNVRICIFNSKKFSCFSLCVPLHIFFVSFYFRFALYNGYFRCVCVCVSQLSTYKWVRRKRPKEVQTKQQTCLACFYRTLLTQRTVVLTIIFIMDLKRERTDFTFCVKRFSAQWL